MHIQHEPNEKNSIQSYCLGSVIINAQNYSQSLFVTKDNTVILPHASSLQDVNYLWLQNLAPNIKEQISILLIGQNKLNQHLTPEQYISFTTQNIGVEQMQFGAACRTFNLLLSEYRKVGIILLI